MEKTPKLILAVAAGAIIAAGLLVYVYRQSKEYLAGPVITVAEPEDGSLSTTSRVILSGTARNLSFLTLNDRKIFTDERGKFKESLLLQEGYNIMTLEARDRFGHTKTKRLELVYKPPESQMENSTTTPPQF